MIAPAILSGLVLVLGGRRFRAARRSQTAGRYGAVELRFGGCQRGRGVGRARFYLGLPTRTQVVLELVGDADGIRHYLRLSRPRSRSCAPPARLLPGVRLSR